MELRIKRLVDGAKLPTYAHSTDAAMDLYAASLEIDEMNNFVYGTGIAVEIPEGFVGLVFPRSSIAKKTLYLTNAVGVIDSGYRGEIMFKFKSTIHYVPQFWNKIRSFLGLGEKIVSLSIENYKIGDRIGQLMIIPIPHIELKEVDFLFPSDRGVGGYGSTGD